MAESTLKLYQKARRQIEVVGLSAIKACEKVGLNINTYKATHRKYKAGAPEQASGTTREETPAANHSQDTASTVSRNN